MRETEKLKKKVLIVACKPYNTDPRIIREINVLLDNGYNVDHICVAPLTSAHNTRKHNNFHVYSIKMKKKRGSLSRYVFEQLYFFLFALFKSTTLIIKNRYSFIQVFTMPEALVFCTIAAKLKRIKILMDWEDPSYEIFLMKFGQGLLAQIILFIEKMSVKFVDHVITPNKAFKETFANRGNQGSKIDIVPNAPDKRIFNPRRIVGGKITNSFEILFNGSIFHRHGLHIGIEAVALVKLQYPKVHLIIICDGEIDYIKSCKKQIKKLNLENNVTWHGVVPIEKIIDFYNRASVVIIPNINSQFTSINFPQRIFECGIMRKPAIVSRLPGILDYMPDDSVQYVEPENPRVLADAIIEVCTNSKKYQSLVNRAWEVCNSISWEKEYLQSIDYMLKK